MRDLRICLGWMTGREPGRQVAEARWTQGTRMRVRRLTATLALSALALSGCSGEGDGEETTSSTVEPTVIDPSGDSSSTSGSSSSSTSGSSTSSTSEADADGPPAAAKANTKEGAEAFAKWYYEQVGEALTSNDSGIVRRFSTGNCKPCRALAKRLFTVECG